MNFAKEFPNQKLEDSIICQNYTSLDNRYNSFNNYQLKEMLYVPDYYKNHKCFTEETKLKFAKSSQTCEKDIVQHRGNNDQSHKNYSNVSKFLLPISSENTYRNHIVSDNRNQCTKNHQLFMNHTKRYGTNL